MVGAALVRRLASEQCRILTVDRTVVDLTRTYLKIADRCRSDINAE
jgi:hypothetical protein